MAEDQLEQLIPDGSHSNSNNNFRLKSIISKISSSMIIICTFILYAIITSIYAGFLPTGAGWRLFSWHPFLMVLGTIGLMGVAVSTKKLGGYKNTKLHAIMTSSGLILAFGGFIAIYKNKDLAGKPHFTSVHSIFGLVTLAGFALSMIGGLIYLHPDFGIDQRDDNKRLVHKWFARTMILNAWITSFLGLKSLTAGMANNEIVLVFFALPLLLLTPVTLL